MRGLLAICWLAVVLAAVGCGAEASPPDVESAADSTKATGSARVETVTRSTFAGQERVFRSSGVVDYTNDRREEATVFPAAGDTSPQSLRTITIGTVSWSELPGSDGIPLGNKRWVRYDSRELEKPEQQPEAETRVDDGDPIVATLVSTAPTTSLDDLLDSLDGVAPDPVRVGDEHVRGVETTRYRTQLDLGEAIRLEGDGGGPVELDIWIGEDGLIRRVVQRHDSTGDPSWSFETTTEFFDFGVEADIQPPPAGEVMEWEELTRLSEAQQPKWLEEQNWLDENQVVGERP